MRYELVEGRLVTTPGPTKPHQMAGKRLERLLDGVAPPEFEAMRTVSLRVGADLLLPDVMVAAAEVLSDPGQSVDPSDAVLVVEIFSLGDSKFERAWKPQWYAEGGIPFYMEIELATMPRIIVYALRGTEYVRIADARAGETLKLSEPFEMSFDPGDLVGPRRSAGQ
jgi:hypothetical protein